jgi:hypothetical protein
MAGGRGEAGSEGEWWRGLGFGRWGRGREEREFKITHTAKPSQCKWFPILDKTTEVMIKDGHLQHHRRSCCLQCHTALPGQELFTETRSIKEIAN